MTRDELLEELASLGLNQSSLATILGLGVSSVSRFGSSRADGIPIPQYAIAFLAAFRALSVTARAKYLAKYCGIKKR